MPYLCITIWCVKHLPLNTMEASLVLSLHQELWEAHHQGSLWEGTCQCQVKDPLLLSTWATLVAPHSIWLHKMEELLPHTIKQWTLPSTLDIKVVHRVWCQVKKISPAIRGELKRKIYFPHGYKIITSRSHQLWVSIFRFSTTTHSSLADGTSNVILWFDFSATFPFLGSRLSQGCVFL